ncbi:hypothetical protein CVV65_05955 [Kyrpidia spormannii]|uniref:Integrase catalytic domain-containing protein n=1 Tax=Kyrpidia spormannii TaxID=2055160 RepID=A0A2K8N7Y1_9BACL|nr:hypothetical protein CVV65_05955 [Kyrpidia spormannii]
MGSRTGETGDLEQRPRKSFHQSTVHEIAERGGCANQHGRPEQAVDNIFTERFWRTLKYEEVYTKEYANPREARESIRTFIHHYNHERPHQSLGYHTPAEIYLKGMRPEDPIRPQVSTEHTYCGKESA